MNQIKLLEQGVDFWNNWRNENPNIKINLSKKNLRLAKLSGINLADALLRGCDLSDSDVSNSNLTNADLSESVCDGANFNSSDLRYSKLSNGSFEQTKFNHSNLSHARLDNSNLWMSDLNNADLTYARIDAARFETVFACNANFSNCKAINTDFSKATLSNSDFSQANLCGAKLHKADLTSVNFFEADLQNTILVKTIIEGSIFTDCKIHGMSVWGCKGNPKDQKNLVITYQDKFFDEWLPSTAEAVLTVDDLKIAQFIYLILNNQNIRDVIDTISTKVVLILGRFTVERKELLDAIKNELRKYNYLPVLFDFEGPKSRDITETITTLAHLARFVIADITEAKSIPQELQAIVPFLPSVPVLPMLEISHSEYGMFEHFKHYPWVLKTYYYKNVNEVIGSVTKNIINPLEEKLKLL